MRNDRDGPVPEVVDELVEIVGQAIEGVAVRRRAP
jgi:hypothetical protein